MKRFLAVAALAAAVVVSASMTMAEGVSLDKIKCILQPTRAAQESKSASWKEGKVYLCCGNCLKAFDGDKNKHAAKANQQLVSTKQYKQEACPFSGGKLDDSTAIEVGGAKVAFCCNNCKGKAEKMADKEKVDALFSEDAFKKGKFSLVKAEK